MKQFLRIFELAMVFIYTGCGIAFLILPDFVNGISNYSRYLLGSLLIIYGGFRGYRVFKAVENKRDEE